MRIILKPHLQIRLKQRLIPQAYPRKIFSEANHKYFDPLTNKKLRPMVIAYDIINVEIQVITVYPTTEQEINNRVKNRRWIKYEES